MWERLPTMACEHRSCEWSSSGQTSRLRQTPMLGIVMRRPLGRPSRRGQTSLARSCGNVCQQWPVSIGHVSGRPVDRQVACGRHQRLALWCVAHWADRRLQGRQTWPLARWADQTPPYGRLHCLGRKSLSPSWQTVARFGRPQFGAPI